MRKQNESPDLPIIKIQAGGSISGIGTKRRTRTIREQRLNESHQERTMSTLQSLFSIRKTKQARILGKRLLSEINTISSQSIETITKTILITFHGKHDRVRRSIRNQLSSTTPKTRGENLIEFNQVLREPYRITDTKLQSSNIQRTRKRKRHS